MAESVSYWICPCGKSNLKSSNKCAGCAKRRPRRLLMYGAILAAVFVGIAMLSPTQPTSDTTLNLPAAQQDFLSKMEAFQAQVGSSPNSLALQRLVQDRDLQIAKIASPESWSGTVLGVQSVQGKGGISIDVGGVNLLAGVHLSYGIDTLIPSSQTAIYDTLLSLRRGDKVTFSGEFENHNGSAVEMSYTSQAAVSNPEFLFNFRTLNPQ
ncbi:hypothetical protein ROLI_048490 (plasmid) [Roseobacter fucihabitans]|uniref:RanBP2-type domain-containing protein n=1 Tax=Roseobacter fucihabitans TaxID=1537242 RepID=A0ABZ2C2Z7_9RHOB|nr:hypothetical protein [Roseobacter litoralis]MBC6967839.1 hypothetical protein [Roseobacter litoralis]